jgi:hypothetical protein
MGANRMATSRRSPTDHPAVRLHEAGLVGKITAGGDAGRGSAPYPSVSSNVGFETTTRG